MLSHLARNVPADNGPHGQGLEHRPAILTMAILTMAILTTAILTMAILTIAILSMAILSMAMTSHHGLEHRLYDDLSRLGFGDDIDHVEIGRTCKREMRLKRELDKLMVLEAQP